MELTFEQISQNVSQIKKQIAEACQIYNRVSEQIEILPVTKLHSIHSIQSLYQLGFRRFGENYANELFDKSEQLATLKDIDWVYIGQLQSNKIQRLIQTCAEIQTVATLKHIDYIVRYAKELNKAPFPIYLCLNAGNEEQKAGFGWHEIDAAIEICKSHPMHISLQGLMCIPPANISNTNDIPPLYTQIAQLTKKHHLKKLSLGMSGDLKPAIAVGSSCVRIGTALLGAR